MTVKSHTCHTIVCDDCGEDLRPGDEYIAHFGSAEEARKDAVEHYEWTRDGDRDLCDHCANIAACVRDGHIPETYDNLPNRYVLNVDSVTWCSRCGQSLSDAAEAQQTSPPDLRLT